MLSTPTDPSSVPSIRDLLTTLQERFDQVLPEQTPLVRQVFTDAAGQIDELAAAAAGEARFRSLLEAAPDAMVIAGADGRIRLVNRQTESLFGYDRLDLIGQPVELLVPPRLHAGHVRHRTDYAVTPHARPMGSGLPLYGQRKDGTEFPVEVSLSPLTLDGDLLIMSAIRDISDRKVAEARQAAQFAATRILAESATVAEAVPRLLRALCEGLGWELGEFWRREPADPTAEHLVWEACWHAPAVNAGEFVTISRQVRFGRGEGLPGAVWAQRGVVWRTDVVADACFSRAEAAAQEGLRSAIGFPVASDGAVAGVLVFFTHGLREPDQGLIALMSDLGSQIGQFLARKAAEEAVHAAMAAAQLARADAERARDEAERANAAKSEFLSRMSHELRTPLNAVLGFAQLLEMDGLPPAQERSVTRILRAGRHLLDLVNEVLDIARIESGRVPLSPEPVRVGEVVRETLDLVRPLAAEQHVELLPGSAETCERFVLADRQRLKQIVLNLLSNAVKYNHPSGTVTVAVTAGPAAAGELVQVPDALGTLGIAVRDTGPGIAAEKLARLFTPFDRLGAEATGVEGTGLGLALAQRLVEAMGGRITVDSVEGAGSSFTVELAEAESPFARHVRTGTEGMSGETPAEHPTRAHTVLYIEDNLPNLELIEELLTRWPQVRLVPAMQGRLGVELARQHQPDLVLLDLHLPDISGEDVLRQLQADPRTRSIPVVVLSADATPGRIERLRATGARAYLTKPLEVLRFLTLVRDILSGQPGEDA